MPSRVCLFGWLLLLASAQADFGESLASFKLAASNAHPWGLCFDDLEAEMLYVADAQANRIFVYRLDGDRLRRDTQADLLTAELHPSFVEPRGLACVDGQLYALSSERQGETYRSRLWSFSSGGDTVRALKLDADLFDLRGCELLDLTAVGQTLFLSYDTSGLESERDQVRRGILRIEVPGGRLAALFGGSLPDDVLLQHLPGSGRAIDAGRARTFGLAWQEVDGTPYLWSTSHHKYLCLADAATGRGIFALRAPGQVWGLTAADGDLWLAERFDGGARVRRLDVAPQLEAPQATGSFLRHVELQLSSTARASLDNSDVQHNYGLPAARPHQSYDPATMRFEASPETVPERLSYDPAGDAQARQEYLQFRFAGAVPAETVLTSRVAIDVSTRRYRSFVFPHLCAPDASVEAGYLEDASIFGLAEADSYQRFLAAAEAAMREEYGTTAASENPYWQMRGLLELIVESYNYGNVKRPSQGHHSFNPVPPKLELLLDTELGNEQLSCSPASFVMAGMARYLGIPSRWIGTTKQRSNWDADGNGLMTRGESALDDAFHRWAEIWLGPVYGWQRFDATPSETAHEHSQFSLMQKVAAGVGSRDLVLLVGGGDVTPFVKQIDGNQRYNLVPRYAEPGSWRQTHELTWSNACFIEVKPPLGGLKKDLLQVEWELNGRWDLDPTARVRVYLVPQVWKDDSWQRARQRYLLGRDVPARDGQLRFDPSRYPAGNYRFLVVKVGDAQTGGESVVLRWGPDEIVVAEAGD